AALHPRGPPPVNTKDGPRGAPKGPEQGHPESVELWGFEPQTSSMPWRRATSCAIAPGMPRGSPARRYFYCTGLWKVLGPRLVRRREAWPKAELMLVGGFVQMRSEYPGVVPESKLEIQMLHDRLLVRAIPDKSERRSSAGLVIPD